MFAAVPFGLSNDLLRFRANRWLAFLIMTIVIALCPTRGEARILDTAALRCHAVTPLAARPDPRNLPYSCSGLPQDYQKASLWFAVTPDAAKRADGNGIVLFVHHTRFDALTVHFLYADGKIVHQSVRAGAFGGRWRISGQIAFTAPPRDAPLTRIFLRVDRLTSLTLLRAHVRSGDDAGIQTGLAALLIGGALTLLLIGAIYDFALAVAVRRQFLFWQGMWATIVLVWGLIWSQAALVVAPGIAGTLASQLCTLLATLAIAVATACAMEMLDGDVISRRVKQGVIALGATVAILGIPASLLRDARLDMLAPILSITMLATLLAVSICIGIAWRKHHRAARDFALAWIVPMATLAATEFIDMGDTFFGGGSQITVLFACAFQTLWLSVSATRRLARLKSERDQAIAAEARMSDLANSDALTGLLNRRGFIEQFEQLAQGCAEQAMPCGLLLIDIDHFKSVNDRFGHDVGDAVLCRIGQRLQRWAGPMCFAGRLGGEEFVLGVAGLGSFALDRFAQSVRQEIGACVHPETGALQAAPVPAAKVTVSIGVAFADDNASGFKPLYQQADERLYEAKTHGRNRVVGTPATSVA